MAAKTKEFSLKAYRFIGSDLIDVHPCAPPLVFYARTERQARYLFEQAGFGAYHGITVRRAAMFDAWFRMLPQSVGMGQTPVIMAMGN